MFYQTDIVAVRNSSQIIPLDYDAIVSLSPKHHSLMELRSQRDLEILKKCYQRFPTLSFQWLDFRNDFHMTNDKNLFIESFKEGLFPLYEGKMIHRFQALFSTPQYFLNPPQVKEVLKTKEVYRIKQDLNINQKEYEELLKSKLLHEDELIKYDYEFLRLGFRSIASDTNERTAIFSLLPKKIGCANSIWSSVPKNYFIDKGSIDIRRASHLRIIFALGIFNSLIVDFITRQMVQINMNKTYLERLPIPQPSDKEIINNLAYKTIAFNALKLQLYNNWDDFEELANLFNIQKKDIPPTPKLYDKLEAQNDVATAKLYGVSYQDFCYMLESFQVLSSKKSEYVALLKSSELWY